MTKLEIETALEYFRTTILTWPTSIRYGRVLAAEVRAQQEKRCETCQHEEEELCTRITMCARGKYPIYCNDVGWTCGVWRRRETD